MVDKGVPFLKNLRPVLPTLTQNSGLFILVYITRPFLKVLVDKGDKVCLFDFGFSTSLNGW